MPPNTAPPLSYADIEERLANRPKPLVLPNGRKVAYLYRAQNGRGHWHIMSSFTMEDTVDLPTEIVRTMYDWFRSADEFIRWAEEEMLAEADRCGIYNQLELSRKSSHPLVRKHE